MLALDPFADLAVVDISRLSNRPDPLRLGSTEDLETGSSLWVVGYPLAAEFTPEPSLDAGEILGITHWDFSGVRWFTVDAPAIGGQSGGAVVDAYGRLVAGSLVLTFFVYVFVNMGMVSGVLPVVGVPLPLVSYGGTSIVTIMAGFGLLMSIHTHRRLLSN